jgi:DNA repair protein RecN (Recombination protein N)
MLQSLTIRNLAIVESLAIRFENGLNVITGETGAGKSVLMGALGLVLGERADKTMIRTGEDKCSVEAVFRLDRPADVNALLDALGLEPCEDGQLIVRRQLSVNETGKHLINDSPATLQALKRLGDLLLDMHGPHDHQSLLNTDFQLGLLDAYGSLSPLREAYATVYRSVTALESQRRDLDGDDTHVAEQIDLLQHQVQEIDDARFAPGDEEELEREHTLNANARRILELAGTARHALTDADAAAFNSMVTVQSATRPLADLLDDAKPWHEEAASIATQIQELSRSITDYVERIEADPERLQYLEDRKALLHKLKRKYGATIPDILNGLETARQKLKDLLTRGQRIATLDAEIKHARQNLMAEGRTLANARRAVAQKLAKAVTRELRELGFAHGSLDIAVQDIEPRTSGINEVDFGFEPNVGEAMRPLRMIASSGEISRVMLAIKTVLAAHDRIPVLVFDEIDANVGGETGNAVGAKLASVAANRQVLCITHLPQVAVHGTTHFVVGKEVSNGRTRTAIEHVRDIRREEEVARMLGGRDLTSVIMRHAREMLAKAAADRTEPTAPSGKRKAS